MVDKILRQNPYDYIGEVKDPRLFAGRKTELETIKEEIARISRPRPILPVIAVVGERRVGKTSLLNRISELSVDVQILPVRINLTSASSTDSWEFWYEVFQRLLMSMCEAGILSISGQPPAVGFQPSGAKTSSVPEKLPPPLLVLQSYAAKSQLGVSQPSLSWIEQDFAALTQIVEDAGWSGVLLVFDEAHSLVDSEDICQQLRYALRQARRCGIVFAGEPRLNQMFTNVAAPFYLQGRIIPLENFTQKSDIVECALLPLDESDRPLMSPMTIDYLARLSRGKPNQIRLICHSIYRRYQRGEQDDLNITIETLDDVLDSIEASYATEYALKKQVDAIRRLNSIDLETLYLMTRYPRWSVEDIVELDEAFRGERRSQRAVERRVRLLEKKRQWFVSKGLLQDTPDRYLLAGDEFLYLYMRFWYEVQKYGDLSRRLELGRGTPTPFGEKAEKLVQSLVLEVRRAPAIEMFRFTRDEGAASAEVIGRVKRRFAALDEVIASSRLDPSKDIASIIECFEICELVGKAGPYFLVALSVRSLDNPRESICIEVYFEGEETLIFPISLLREQAEAAKVLIEEFDAWLVQLPNLDGFVKAVGGESLEEVVEGFGIFERWMVKAIQRLVERREEKTEPQKREAAKAETKDRDWHTLYRQGKLQEALETLTSKLAENPARQEAARLYNDRGYIRYGLKQVDLARGDLQRAIDLHFRYLPLSLLNLAIIAIDSEEWSAAIEKSEDALLLSHSRENIRAGYLRLRLLGGHLLMARNQKCEQSPANVIEAAYINLSYSLAKLEGYKAAVEVLQEGLELIPSSVRLKHALARLHLHYRQAKLADPLYTELVQEIEFLDDQTLINEVRMYKKLGPAYRRKKG